MISDDADEFEDELTPAADEWEEFRNDDGDPSALRN